MKRLVPQALVLGFFLLPDSILAHYSMVLPQEFTNRLGQPVTIIYQWGHPFEHQLSDAASPESVTILAPSGGKVDVTQKLEPIELPAADGKKVRAFRFQLTPEERGDFIVVLRTPPIWMESESAFVQDNVQVVLHVQAQKGWDAAMGKGLEMTPLTRPYGLQPGMVFQARIRGEGKAMTGTMVEIERYNSTPPTIFPPDEHITRAAKTDSDGVVTVSLLEPGWWGLTASRDVGKKEHQGKTYPIRERVTFWVHVDDPKKTNSSK